jgi:hypothetical protein
MRFLCTTRPTKTAPAQRPHYLRQLSIELLLQVLPLLLLLLDPLLATQ